jgi:AcrR family transcriptional regulator
VTELGLRDRKKQRTRQLLAETARRLFTEQGFEQVSVAQIAAAAEVSVATVFNYFPTKEDLVYSGLETFEQQMLDAIRERPRGQDIITAFSEFILEPRGLLAAQDDASARQLVAVSRMIAASPALLAREQQVLARYTDALARVITQETRAAVGDVRAQVVANALIGVHRALIAHVREQLRAGTIDRWRIARDVRKRGKAALSLLAGGVGDYGAKP